MQEYSVSSAVVLVALFICFIALVFWAWSKKRQATFIPASQIPLADDETFIEGQTQKHQSPQIKSSNSQQSEIG